MLRHIGILQQCREYSFKRHHVDSFSGNGTILDRAGLDLCSAGSSRKLDVWRLRLCYVRSPIAVSANYLPGGHLLSDEQAWQRSCVSADHKALTPTEHCESLMQ